MSVAVQVILSALVLTLLGWTVYRERVITRLRGLRRKAFRDGRKIGYDRGIREWRHSRKIELLNAGRKADVRPDSGPAARISPIRIQRHIDT